MNKIPTISKPHLLDDWRRIARKAWSFKFAILTSVLCAAEVGIQLFAAVRPTPWLAMVAALTSLAAGISRLFAQPKSFGRE